MIRRISKLFLLAALMTAFSVSASAQMKDEDVMKYMEEASVAGKSQTEMARELAAKGMTMEQFERLKAKYESVGVKASPSGTPTSVSDRLRKMDVRLMELELDVALDSLASLEPEVKDVFGRNIFAN